MRSCRPSPSTWLVTAPAREGVKSHPHPEHGACKGERNPRRGCRHRDADCRSYARFGMRGSLRDVMTRDLLIVAPEDTLGEAAEKMAGRSVGAALVMDAGRLVGILTERDLLAAVAGRVQTNEAPVREWMAEKPLTFPRRRRSKE